MLALPSGLAYSSATSFVLVHTTPHHGLSQQTFKGFPRSLIFCSHARVLAHGTLDNYIALCALCCSRAGSLPRMSTEAGQRPPGTVTEGSPEILTVKESSLKLPVKKRVVSGVQPTGNLHFGNYLGAIKQWATNQARGGVLLACCSRSFVLVLFK